MSRLLLIASVTVLLGAAPAGAAGQPPASLFVAPGGSDSGSCTASSPCRSFNRAYQTAQPGQVVEVAAGTYGDQTLNPARKSSAGAVVFRPAAGASVTAGEIRISGASGVEFDGMTMNDFYIAAGSDTVTFRNDNMRYFFIRSASDVSVIGGSVGGEDDAISPTIGAAFQSTVPSRNVVIDGVTFHDITRANKPGEHLECLFVQSVDGLTLRRSRFRNCNIFDVYVNSILGAPAPANLLFENNLFGSATDGGFYSLYVRNDPGEVIDGLTIRSNSFAQGFHLDAGSYTNGRVYGNVSAFRQTQCTSGLDWQYNVFDGAKCGPTDRQAPLGFVDPQNLDLHLVAGAAAIGLDASPGGPSVDADGNLRPLRAARDAGAEQREPVRFVVGRSLGAVTIGAARQQVEAFYGPPSAVTSRRFGGKRTPAVRLATYREPGGVLWVGYAGDTVVGVGTTRPYYTNAAGAGVGAAVDRGHLGGLRWRACPGDFFARLRGVDTWLTPTAHQATRPIASVWILAAAYDAAPVCRKR